MRAFIQSSQTHIQHEEGKIMVQKVQVVKVDSNENPIPLNIDDSGNQSVQVKGTRAVAAGCTAHRTARTYGDLLGPTTLAATNIPNNQIAPTVPTLTGATGGQHQGSIAAASYYVGYAIKNGAGVTMASTITAATALTANYCMNVAIPAAWQISGADVYYEFFMSADAAPKHVGTISAANVATGGYYQITTSESAFISGTGAAWTVDLGVLNATGMTTNTAPFAQNTAYTLGSITPVNTVGYNNVDVFVDVSVTSLGVATQPSLTLLPVFLDDKGGVNYHVGAPITVSIEGAVGQSKRQALNLTTNGASIAVLVANIQNVTLNTINITPTSVV